MAYDLGLTRRTPYADIVRAESPYAKNAYFDKISRDRARDAQNLQRTLSEKQLTQSASQFKDNLGLNQQQLEESKRQFAATNALQKQQLEDEASRADLATGISTVGLGIEAYPYVKDAGAGLSDLLFADSAAGATGATAATGTGTTAGVGAGTAAGEAASSASSGASGAGTAAAILAIIAGQHKLGENTKTNFEGQRTGDFFTFDDQGRWAPRIGNEPWHGFANQQWGLKPSAGEQFDAAMYNGDLGLAARRTPAAVQQWLNPVGDFGYDAIEGRWGSDIAGTLDPLTYSFDKVAEAKDIGDFAAKGAQASAKVIDPVGTLVGGKVKDTVTDWTGNETLGDVANALVNPVGAASDFISNWSYLCTQTEKTVGLGKNDKRYLNVLNEFGKDHVLGRHYHKNAPLLIDKISSTEGNLEAFYSKFYVETIAPVIQLVKHGKMVEARNRYLSDYLNLLEIYTPELYPEAEYATL